MANPDKLDDVPVQCIERAVQAACEFRDADARVELASISTPDFARLPRFKPAGAVKAMLETMMSNPVSTTRRQAAPMNLYASVYERDRYTCRYCGTRTIHLRILNLLSHLFGDVFPGDEDNWRPPTHPVYWGYSTSFEHLTPVVLGGGNRLDNLITTCSRCNYGKNSTPLQQLGWTVLEPSDSDWDGLTHFYQALLARTPSASAPGYKNWLRALGASTAEVRGSQAQASNKSPKYEADLAAASVDVQQVAALLSSYAVMHGYATEVRGSRLAVLIAETEAISLYPVFNSAYFNLEELRARGLHPQAAAVLQQLKQLADRKVTEKNPGLSCNALLARWDEFESLVLPKLADACRKAFSAS